MAETSFTAIMGDAADSLAVDSRATRLHTRAGASFLHEPHDGKELSMHATLVRNVEFVEDEEQPIEIRLQASTAAVQAGLAFSKVIEQHDLQREMAELEWLAKGNGHPR
jgi:hypothetical protein